MPNHADGPPDQRLLRPVSLRREPARLPDWPIALTGSRELDIVALSQDPLTTCPPVLAGTGGAVLVHAGECTRDDGRPAWAARRSRPHYAADSWRGCSGGSLRGPRRRVRHGGK